MLLTQYRHLKVKHDKCSYWKPREDEQFACLCGTFMLKHYMPPFLPSIFSSRQSYNSQIIPYRDND